MTKTPKPAGVSVEMPVGYADTLTALKARVREAQFRPSG